jgi:hypothetical protein
VLAVVVLISVAVLFQDVGGFAFSTKRGDALDCACLGITLSAACGIRVLERWETRRHKPKQSQTKYVFGALACLTAFLICARAL